MRFRMILGLGAAVLVAMAANGCARRLVGTPIKEDDVPKLAIGRTTKTEVLSVFGAPYSIEARGDQEILTYVHGSEFAWTIGIYSENRRTVDLLTIFLAGTALCRIMPSRRESQHPISTEARGVARRAEGCCGRDDGLRTLELARN